MDLNWTTSREFVSELAENKEVFSSSCIATPNYDKMSTINKEPVFDITQTEDSESFSQISLVSSVFGGIAGLPNDADVGLPFSNSLWPREFRRDEHFQKTSASIMESLQPPLKDTSQTLGSKKNLNKCKGNKRKFYEIFSQVEKDKENQNGPKGKEVIAPASISKNNKKTPNEETIQKNPKRRKIIPKQEKVRLSFSCNISSKSCPTKNKSIVQKQMHKSGSSPDPCVLCGKTFRLMSQRNTHRYTHMTWEQLQRTRVFHAKCYFCNDQRTFLQYGNYERHFNIHSQEKPNKCRTCSKRFADPSHLQRHESSHSKQKRFECNKCLKRFTQSSSLKAHDLVHMDRSTRDKIENSWKYECEFCKKKFRTPSHLERHTPTHTGEKRFSCSHCHKRFTQKSSKLSHEKLQH